MTSFPNIYKDINHSIDFMDDIIDVDDMYNLPVDDEELLLLASYNGYENIVGYLVDRCIDVNIQDSIGNTPLILSAMNGHISICELLIRSGSDIDIQDGECNTVLMWSILRKHDRLTQVLMSKDAILSGNLKYMKCLIDSCRSIIKHQDDNLNGVKNLNLLLEYLDNDSKLYSRLLSYAIRNKKVEYVKLLLQYVDVNTTDYMVSPLIVASTNLDGNYDEYIINLLLDNKADVNLECNRGTNTALRYAYYSGSTKLVKLLITNNANIDICMGDIGEYENLIDYALNVEGKIELGNWIKTYMNNTRTASMLYTIVASSKHNLPIHTSIDDISTIIGEMIYGYGVDNKGYMISGYNIVTIAKSYIMTINT